MISIEGLSVEFSAKPLFRNVSFVVNDRDRIALVGKNGAGKSTILDAICLALYADTPRLYSTKMQGATMDMKNKLLIGLGVFGVLLLGGYLGTAVYFNSHYLMNTTIAGIPCGAKTPDFVKEENSRSVAEYLLTIYDRENTKFHIRGMDISYAYVPSGEEEQILKRQNPFTWPLSLFQAQDFELSKSVSFDSDALSRQLQGLAFFSEDYITKPENAYLSIAEDSFEVVPEILGNEPIFDNVYALVSEAVSNMEETVTLTDA